MINQQVLEGHWNEIKGKLRQRWGQLTDDDVRSFSGQVDQLVGTIQRKTGETRERIEAYLSDLTNDGASLVSHVAETAREYGQQAVETVKDAAGQVVDRVRQGYNEAERLVERRPVESLAVVFGAGLIAGVIVGLTLRSR